MTVENDFGVALDRIADPASGKGLVSAGRVPLPRIRDGVATLVLLIDGLSGDAITRIEAAIRDAASTTAGVSEVRIVRTAERRERRLIAVASGKGGVGKSNVAVNLAVGLARLVMTARLTAADRPEERRVG